MPRPPPRLLVLLSFMTVFLCYIVWTREHEGPIRSLKQSHDVLKKGRHNGNDNTPAVAVAADTEAGGVIMGRLGNETLKAELGRAAWKLFHTTMARFPDAPTQDESDALKSYIYLFARLYPCGECAEHFQAILRKYPPQTASRSSAAAWACFVHNQVNESKGKPIFDCGNIGDFYDCGCADDGDDDGDEPDERVLPKTGARGKSDAADAERPIHVEIEREDATRGG